MGHSPGVDLPDPAHLALRRFDTFCAAEDNARPRMER